MDTLVGADALVAPHRRRRAVAGQWDRRAAVSARGARGGEAAAELGEARVGVRTADAVVVFTAVALDDTTDGIMDDTKDDTIC